MNPTRAASGRMVIGIAALIGLVVVGIWLAWMGGWLGARPPKLLATFDAHEKGVYALVFSPDGRTLASGGDPGNDKTSAQVRLWDVTSRREKATLEEGKGAVFAVAFSPDGKTLVTGGEDWVIRRWDVAHVRELEVLDGHAGSVLCLAFSPDGRTLAAGRWDHTVRLYDPVTGERKAILRRHASIVRSVAFSSDGKLLASGGAYDDQGGKAPFEAPVRLWNGETGEPVRGFGPEETRWPSGDRTAYPEGANSVVFRPDGRVLVAGYDSGIVKFWDTDTGRELGSIVHYFGHSGEVNAVCLSPDGKTLAVGGREPRPEYDPGPTGHTITLYDVDTGAVKAALKGDDNVLSLAFSPDGRLLAAGGRVTGTIQLWALK